MVKVKEIMKRFVVTALPEITLSEAAKIMTANRVGSVVIVDRNDHSKPVGMVTNEDIVGVIAEGKDPAKLKASDIKKRKLFFVSPEEDLNNATKRMIKTGCKRMPVVDENGKLVGIISEKEIVLVSPEMLNILSEKLKMRVESVKPVEGSISGICEGCEGYSDDLKNVAGKWLCESCRENQ